MMMMMMMPEVRRVVSPFWPITNAISARVREQSIPERRSGGWLLVEHGGRGHHAGSSHASVSEYQTGSPRAGSTCCPRIIRCGQHVDRDVDRGYDFGPRAGLPPLRHGEPSLPTIRLSARGSHRPAIRICHVGQLVAAAAAADSNIHLCLYVPQDGGGTITIKELGAVFETLGQKPNQEELKMMMDEVDKDKSGAIDLTEFCQLMGK